MLRIIPPTALPPHVYRASCLACGLPFDLEDLEPHAYTQLQDADDPRAVVGFLCGACAAHSVEWLRETLSWRESQLRKQADFLSALNEQDIALDPRIEAWHQRLRHTDPHPF